MVRAIFIYKAVVESHVAGGCDYDAFSGFDITDVRNKSLGNRQKVNELMAFYGALVKELEVSGVSYYFFECQDRGLRIDQSYGE